MITEEAAPLCMAKHLSSTDQHTLHMQMASNCSAIGTALQSCKSEISPDSRDP
jgi:hypothetical protein